MTDKLPKLATPLGPLLPRLDFSAEAGQAVAGAATAGEALLRLEAAGHASEAVHLTAHALPRRESVWWACMCAGVAPEAVRTPADLAACQAAEAWVRNPSDDALRRKAWEAAQYTNFKTPEAWAAVGAFWSGGSMAPLGQPVVPPQEHLTGVAVGSAVILASVRIRPELAMDRLKRFLSAARDIAAGGAGRLPVERL